ncbi:MFS transporter [Dyadobacter endophyticus]|uniref:Hexuronate transporter n=1 Tax=Dyadobacter endophyticus TaxID=1749036 RepID=A0ABQ1YPI3_9BACT|nr:MFS transporter [Dyadobacter endophyticus]GGH31677.1 hexuronate transporter [Dyadobacter endophyticus]
MVENQIPVSPAIKMSGMRWVMVGMAFLATVLNYVHRLSFNYLSAEGELRKLIPDDAFGYIGTAFFAAYMISNAFSGFVIDRLGTRVGYSLCMAFWTTAGLVHAFASTPFQFGVCRFMLGIGEAGNWPAAIRLTTEWFPPHERSTASGIFNSGSALGAVIVPPLVALLGVNYGWQATFVILAVCGYLWLVAFWFIYYTPKENKEEKKEAFRVPVKALLKTRFVRMFTLSKTFMDPVWYFVTFWIGRYLVDVHHLEMKQIGWLAMIPFVIADVGNIAGGYFTQYIIKRGMPIPRARKVAVTIASLIMILPLLAGPFVISTPISALIVFGLAGFGYTAYTANTLTFPADVVPKNSAASVWGMACVGTGLGGAVFQSVSGIILKNNAAEMGYHYAYNILFLGFGLVALVGLLIMLFLMGPLVPDKSLLRYGEGVRP